MKFSFCSRSVSALFQSRAQMWTLCCNGQASLNITRIVHQDKRLSWSAIGPQHCIVATHAQRKICTVCTKCLQCNTLDMELPKPQFFHIAYRMMHGWVEVWFGYSFTKVKYFWKSSSFEHAKPYIQTFQELLSQVQACLL